jgi:hypothetical protein
MEAGRRTTSQKCLTCNQRVSGAVGDFISGPSKRCRRHRLFGNMIRAIGERHYLVRFDDGQEKECSSNILKVETLSSSLHPDIPLPAHDMVWDTSAVEKASGDPDLLDNEEVEDMPAIRPEEDDAEAANEEENQSDTDSFKKTAEVLQDNNDIYDDRCIFPCQPPQCYQFEQ